MKTLALPNIPESLKSSPTWPYVLRFAIAMEARLALPENQAKGNRWREAKPSDLLNAGAEHAWRFQSLLRAVYDGVPIEKEQLLRRAVNAANYIMMTADAVGALVPADEEVTQPNAQPLPPDDEEPKQLHPWPGGYDPTWDEPVRTSGDEPARNE